MPRLRTQSSAVSTLFCIAACAPAPREPQWIFYPAPPAPARVVHLLTFDSLDELLPPAPDLFSAGRPAVRAGAPLGVAYHDSCLYVCDTSAGCVHVWDLQRGQARALGLGGELTKPVAVAADCAGRICVADASRGQVLVFDSSGRRLSSFAPKDRTGWRPAGLACAGGSVYVADVTGHAVQAWSVEDGQLIDSLGEGSEGPLSSPCGLAFDAAGRLLVAEPLAGRVQVLVPSGEGDPAARSRTPALDAMARPRAVAVGPDGMVFVADAGLGCIHVFDEERQPAMRIGLDGVTPLPNGLCIGRDVPAAMQALVPKDFAPAYYLWVSNTLSTKGLALFAVGQPVRR
jgi:sugar lactone lactonase YvrE